MSAELLPEADRLDQASHPRVTERLYGQDTAEAALLAALRSGRLPHGWLFTGPEGVGKATLAWRFARVLLEPEDTEAGLFGAPPPRASLEVDRQTPLQRRITALAEPRLALVRRSADDKGKLRGQIVVDDIRRLKDFTGLTAADGGRRVVVIDAADDLNGSAANALLKLLEEPPARTILILIAHQPMLLLPTIRSRCRVLRVQPLAAGALADALAAQDVAVEPGDRPALAALAAGSVRTALQLLDGDGIGTYAALVAVLAGMPGTRRDQIARFAETVSGRGLAGEQKTALAVHLVEAALARLALTGSRGATPGDEAAAGEATVLLRLAPSAAAGRAWAEAAQTLLAETRAGLAVNLDPAVLILNMLVKIDALAARTAAR